jgi:lipopolysaccharide transport system permease protein
MILVNKNFNYASYIFANVKRDFQIKYRNSLVGAVWSIVNPLTMILIYTIIFSQIMSAKLPGVDNNFGYCVYVCSGLLTWQFFIDIVLRGQNIFIENSNYIKKISFPRIVLPVIAIANAFLNFVIGFIIFLVFLMLAEMLEWWMFFAFTIVVSIQILFAISLGVILGVLNVFFRDVGQFFSIFLQIWFWGTPVVYSKEILSESMQYFLTFNPMFPLITSYQNIFLIRKWPDWNTIVYPLALGLILSFLAIYLYRKLLEDLLDEI